MRQRTRITATTLRVGATALVVAGAAPAALAQADAATSAGAVGMAIDPSPYYIGASQALSHDSNVYKVPFGPSDTYSSTSLLAGFDQPIGRQRLFGTASVSYHRYFQESALNNTSYNLSTGVDWETVMRLSGRLAATLDQRLSSPAAANAGSLQQEKNTERRQGFSGLGRWGGGSTLSLEARAATTKVDQSSNALAAAELRENEYGLAGYYRPGSKLRLGVGVRYERTRVPRAFVASDGSEQDNVARARHLDLLARYDSAAFLSADARLSYTRQRNSSLPGADFSGVTGSLGVGYRATGKLGFDLTLARVAGFDTATAGISPLPGTATGTDPALVRYESNRVTDSVAVGARYAATAKIVVSANARYARAKLVSSVSAAAGQTQTDVTDETRGAGLGVSYAYSRVWNFDCNVSRDRREVSGAGSFGYSYTVAGCGARFLWR